MELVGRFGVGIMMYLQAMLPRSHEEQPVNIWGRGRCVALFFVAGDVFLTNKSVSFCENLRDSARFCLILRDSVSFCEILRDSVSCIHWPSSKTSVSFCEILRESARICEILRESALGKTSEGQWIIWSESVAGLVKTMQYLKRLSALATSRSFPSRTTKQPVNKLITKSMEKQPVKKLRK